MPDETEVAEAASNKYLARSFLLPLLMGVAYTALLWGGKLSDERQMALVGLMLLSFAGVFNASEAFKTWATLRYPPQKPTE